MPLVSAVLPLYNKEDCIDRALRSILGQTLDGFEIIVVNDGSTDASVSVARAIGDPRITIIDQANAGPGAARNRGAAAAGTPLLAFLDGDDEWGPGFLEAALDALARHPECVAYVCGYDSGAFRQERPNHVAKLVDRAGPVTLAPDISGAVIKEHVNALHSSCLVVRKSVFDALGGFFSRNRCLFGEDSFFWLQVLMAGPIYWDPAEHSVFHVEDSSLGFAITVRHSARPISLYPDELARHCPADYQPALRRAVRCYVEHDLRILRESKAFLAAYRLRRQHGLPAVSGLVGDLAERISGKIRRTLSARSNA